MESNGVVIDNCDFAGSDGSISVRINASAVKITHNWFEFGPNVGGTHIVQVDGSSLIAQNHIGNTRTGGNQIEIQGGKAIIAGNTINGANASAIVISTGGTEDWTVITGNQISNFKNYAVEVNGGIETVIVGNLFYSTPGANPSGHITGTKSYIVVGNTFRSSDVDDIYASDGIGCRLFANNRVYRMGGAFNGALYVGNIIEGFGTAATGLYGICAIGNWVTNVENGIQCSVIISNNYVSDANTDGIITRGNDAVSYTHLTLPTN